MYSALPPTRSLNVTSERYLGRESQAKLYLAIITAYLGAVAFKTTELLRSVS
jgi:hypothetical protein